MENLERNFVKRIRNQERNKKRMEVLSTEPNKGNSTMVPRVPERTSYNYGNTLWNRGVILRKEKMRHRHYKYKTG
jgi:hypothetical protein